MSSVSAVPAVAAVDRVDLVRFARLLDGTGDAQLKRVFTAAELAEPIAPDTRPAHLAALYAAKRACVKLFAREAALALVDVGDFGFATGSPDGPVIAEPSARAETVLGLHRVARVEIRWRHAAAAVEATASTVPMVTETGWLDRLAFRLVPARRQIVLENLRQVYAQLPEAEILRLAQAHYGHLLRLAAEFLLYPLKSRARKLAMARVEGLDELFAAHARGNGVLVLTGHFGNFEVATAAALAQFPEGRGRFHFLARPFRPAWFNAWVTRRLNEAGFGVLPKNGSLEWVFERLAAGDIVVFPFDQHAGPKLGIRVPFFGRPAGTFRALALVAKATGAPVVPGACWREPDGRHVLRFEPALEYLEDPDQTAEVRRNTRAYNAVLERLIVRHPEQWFWVHRRWKDRRHDRRHSRRRRMQE